MNESIDRPPLCWPMPGERDKEMLRFHYGSAEMWKKSPDDLLRLGHVELLTMLPLTQGGMERDVVEMMFTRLIDEQYRHLATIGFLFTALAFRHAKRYDDQQWLERRYNHMHDILRDSPAYQWILDEGIEQGETRGRILGKAEGKIEGRAEGLEQGLQQGSQKALQQAVITIVVTRFADLEELARTRITAVDNPNRLQHLIIDLTISHSREEVERILYSL